jgi:hypothetical protein
MPVRTAWNRPLTGGLPKEMTATARSTRYSISGHETKLAGCAESLAW